MGLIILLSDWVAFRKKLADKTQGLEVMTGILGKCVAQTSDIDGIVSQAVLASQHLCRKQPVLFDQCHCLRGRLDSIRRIRQFSDRNSGLRDVLVLMHQVGSSDCAAIKQFSYNMVTAIGDELDTWCCNNIEADTRDNRYVRVESGGNKRRRVNPLFKQWVPDA